ncbi:hypothetical protein SAMN05421821_104108 [Mucilaginibacter lappiensis]|uniref:Glutamine cyclotransferase n=1 Tax=Mucilaginibacter lappiensis TaxID=354630 RepID=A0ABR6PI78_9SPHI|nr:hypothetical protein [Mucilaginibacter lappiensis]MBB6109479.1 hypothetical protein [Mucilaginibacter lappiensis]SIQ93707.1 hypothetical protein SAMN05421821_104108 [Mucilaginibacter lappiensis]
MKKLFFTSITILCLGFFAFLNKTVDMTIARTITIDSLGACQGISYQNGRIFLYGDREVGIIREFKLVGDSLTYINKEYKLTQDGQDVINHPTGIAYNGTGPTFMGNSIRLNKEGTKWRAVIYCINWKGLLKTGTLDGNLMNTIDDDACIQGTRPEYVKYNNKWYVATADYGNNGNEIRLYDPEVLRAASKTSEKGVLYKKFTCTAWVQNLHWIASKNTLVLIQNQKEGRMWRFTYIDLKKSIETGTQQVIREINIDGKQDELEGFSFLGDAGKGIAVSSSRKNNVTFTNTSW